MSLGVTNPITAAIRGAMCENTECPPNDGRDFARMMGEMRDYAPLLNEYMCKLWQRLDARGEYWAIVGEIRRFVDALLNRMVANCCELMQRVQMEYTRPENLVAMGFAFLSHYAAIGYAVVDESIAADDVLAGRDFPFLLNNGCVYAPARRISDYSVGDIERALWLIRSCWGVLPLRDYHAQCDARDSANVENIQSLERFLRLLARRLLCVLASPWSAESRVCDAPPFVESVGNSAWLAVNLNGRRLFSGQIVRMLWYAGFMGGHDFFVATITQAPATEGCDWRALLTFEDKLRAQIDKHALELVDLEKHRKAMVAQLERSLLQIGDVERFTETRNLEPLNPRAMVNYVMSVPSRQAITRMNKTLVIGDLLQGDETQPAYFAETTCTGHHAHITNTRVIALGMCIAGARGAGGADGASSRNGLEDLSFTDQFFLLEQELIASAEMLKARRYPTLFMMNQRIYMLYQNKGFYARSFYHAAMMWVAVVLHDFEGNLVLGGRNVCVKGPLLATLGVTDRDLRRIVDRAAAAARRERNGGGGGGADRGRDSDSEDEDPRMQVVAWDDQLFV
jgi:hypothetical protein